MCDCYQHKCNHKDCNVRIPMHLEDYSTGRDEVEVFCGSHIPEKSDRKDGVLWSIGQGKSKSKIFIRALTKDARTHWKGNHYNGDGGCEYIEAFGKPIKKGKKK